MIICKSHADQFLHFKDDVNCVLLVTASLTFRVSDVPHGKRSFAYAGTHYLTI